MSQMLKNFDGYSDNLALVNAIERTFQEPKATGGRVRCATFSYESSSATADGANIALAILPEGAKILHIHYEHEAMGTTGALDLGLFTPAGVEIDDDVFVAADDISSAGTNDLYPVLAAVGSDFYEVGQPAVLTATVETALWAADKYLKGFVLYVEN